MRGKLNSFQKSMLQWNEMYPYSAVHAVRVRGSFNLAHVWGSIQKVLGRYGLGQLTLDLARGTYAYESQSATCDVQVIEPSPDALSALLVEMQRQLNVPFDFSRPFNPFRFVAVPAEDSFLLGVAYFHPVADAESIVRLLKDIVAAFAGDPTTGCLFRRYPGVVVHKLLAIPRQLRLLGRSFRAAPREIENMSNGLTGFSLTPGELRLLKSTAENWKVSVNDLLMAILMKALGPCASGRLQARKRRLLTLGCIVNLRKDLGVDGRRTFGLFLGSFTVTHAVPAEGALQSLAEDIQHQTAALKRHRLYVVTPLELGVARFLLRFFSPQRRKKLYAKHYPLWGGITNMNLNAMREPAESSSLLDYFRGVSTGPITPLVLSFTTFGDHANLCLSYRTAVFSSSDIGQIQGRFRQTLGELGRGV
jgi:hypothetical protein